MNQITSKKNYRKIIRMLTKSYKTNIMQLNSFFTLNNIQLIKKIHLIYKFYLINNKNPSC